MSLRGILLYGLFSQIFSPGTTMLNQFYTHLDFVVKEVPKRPWPLAVGGLPITITDGVHGRARVFPRRINGNPSISIFNERNFRRDGIPELELRQLAVEI